MIDYDRFGCFGWVGWKCVDMTRKDLIIEQAPVPRLLHPTPWNAFTTASQW